VSGCEVSAKVRWEQRRVSFTSEEWSVSRLWNREVMWIDLLAALVATPIQPMF
jgi:hypothetical protein